MRRKRAKLIAFFLVLCMAIPMFAGLAGLLSAQAASASLNATSKKIYLGTTFQINIKDNVSKPFRPGFNTYIEKEASQSSAMPLLTNAAKLFKSNLSANFLKLLLDLLSLFLGSALLQYLRCTVNGILCFL